MYIEKLLDSGVWIEILKDDFFHNFLIYQAIVITIFLIFFIPRLRNQQLKFGQELQIELAEKEKYARQLEDCGYKNAAQRMRERIADLREKYKICLQRAKEKRK